MNTMYMPSNPRSRNQLTYNCALYVIEREKLCRHIQQQQKRTLCDTMIESAMRMQSYHGNRHSRVKENKTANVYGAQKLCSNC